LKQHAPTESNLGLGDLISLEYEAYRRMTNIFGKLYILDQLNPLIRRRCE
jgi:hypothetical protein